VNLDEKFYEEKKQEYRGNLIEYFTQFANLKFFEFITYLEHFVENYRKDNMTKIIYQDIIVEFYSYRYQTKIYDILQKK
jgi:hypothetical protein